MSAPVSPSGQRPPPSTAKANFAGSVCSAMSERNRDSSSRAIATPSAQSGSMPAKGDTITLRTASAWLVGSSRPRSASATVNSGRHSSRTPRSCRLARWVRSISPLPCSAANAAIACAIWLLTAPAVIRSRTSRPSPAGIGRSTPGHQPFLSVATFMGPPPLHCTASRRN